MNVSRVLMSIAAAGVCDWMLTPLLHICDHYANPVF